MLKTLISAQMQMFINSMFRGTKTGKKRGVGFKLLVALLAVYCIGCFFMLFGMVFYSLCEPLCQAGLGWLYFSMAGIMGFTLPAIMCIFFSQSVLYEARDNELLLSMPIPPSAILASRMLSIMAISYLLELFVLLPAGVCYLLSYPATFVGVLFFVLQAVFLPLFSTAISCFIGWLLVLLTNRLPVRVKSLLTTLFSLAFLAAYMVVCMQFQNYIGVILANGDQIATTIRSALAPAYFFGAAVAQQNAGYFFGFILCAVLPFLLLLYLLSRTFIAMATVRRGAKKVKYVRKQMRTKSLLHACIDKELSHFLSSPAYMLNSSMGILFTVLLAGAAIIKRDEILQAIPLMPGLQALMGPLAVAAVASLASMDMVSAPSISLEGKYLWITQAVPVDGSVYLFAKAYVHMLICMPANVIAAVLLAVFYPLQAVDVLLLLLVPAAMTAFEGFFGVWINLKFPRFDFVNETAVVKQSASVMIAMFGSMAMVVGLVVLYVLVLMPVLSAYWYLALVTVLLAAATGAIALYFKKYGGKAYAMLNHA